MEQHPIPRQITTFEFKLIGFMTLRQFMYLAVAFPVGYIVYVLFPIPFIDILLGIVVAFVGIAFAFIPYQDRPLDQWVKNLWKRLNSPTQYYYQKHNDALYFLNDLYFLADPHHMIAHIESKEKLAQYLSSTKQRKRPDYRKKQVAHLINQPSHKLQSKPSAHELAQGAGSHTQAPPSAPVQDIRKASQPVYPGGGPGGLGSPGTSGGMGRATTTQAAPSVPHYETVKPGTAIPEPIIPEPTIQILSSKQLNQPGPIPPPLPKYQTQTTTQSPSDPHTIEVTTPAIPAPQEVTQPGIPAPQEVTQFGMPAPQQAFHTTSRPVAADQPIDPGKLQTTLSTLQQHSDQQAHQVISQPAGVQSQQPSPSQPQPSVQPQQQAGPQSNQHTPDQHPSQPVVPQVIPAPQSQQTITVPSPRQQGPTGASRPPSSKNYHPQAQVEPSRHPFIMGMVKNAKGIPLPGILVYIKDRQGNPVRLMKTNPHGAFVTFNPFTIGEYKAEIKDPAGMYFFDTMNMNVKQDNPVPYEFISKEIL